MNRVRILTRPTCRNTLGANQRRTFSHVPVMKKEIVKILKPDHGKVYIDMTFGGGGHTRALLASNKSIKIVAVDRDPMAVKKAQELSSEIAIKSEKLGIKQTVIPVHGKFSKVMRDIHLSGIPYGSVNGVLFDLGASSMQYDNSCRGFSLSSDGPLDMRMDTTLKSDITAEDVVNNLSQEHLAYVLKTLGEERRSRKIANAIVDARTLLGRIKTTKELSRIISTSTMATPDALGRFAHPGTRTFQALRIFVNNELNELNYALEKIHEFLIPASQVHSNENGGGEIEPKEPYGVAVVLSFHSLEDRIVKRHFSCSDMDQPFLKQYSQHDRIRTNTQDTEQQVKALNEVKKWKQVYKHVVKPSEEEIAHNPRSRSAKLRAAIRLA